MTDRNNSSESGVVVYSEPRLQDWELDKDKVTAAVKEVSANYLINHDPEDYFDHKNLREGIEDALNDPEFPRYLKAHEDYEAFREAHPQMVKDLEEPKDEKELLKYMSRVSISDPLYFELKRLSDWKAIAMLRLHTNMVSAHVLDIAATYAKLAKIVFQ
ncbi:MAG: hypothetical protein HYV90_00125 [Candidatus Woesebacteria bacterium]|nr:MAG: hypothetical protein HYV90_00125 [Candidatus Woesebacteria bacterium]